MRLYAAIAARSFQRYSGYRSAVAAGAFTNTVFGFIMAYTYIALWAAKPDLGDYNVNEAVTYVWLGQSLGLPMALFGGGFQQDFTERIRKGDVAIDLYRPVDMMGWWLATDTGRAAFHFLARGIPPTLAGAMVFDLVLPTEPVRWASFLVALVLGFLVSFMIRYIVSLTAFWLMDSRGVDQLASIAAMFFTGMVLPLNVFPGLLGEVARALPWSASLQIPVDVLLGKHVGVDLLQTFAFQGIWALVLFVAARLLTNLATSKVVVQGG